MENITTDDFINVICLRNQLFALSFDEFIKVHRDEEKFITFLDTFAVLTEIDSAFLLFSDKILEKVENVIYDNRFKYSDPEIVEAVNRIVAYLNSVRAYDDSYRNLLKNGYLSYHEDCRKTTIDDEDVFLQSLAYDAIVYFALKEDRMDAVGNCDAFFLASVNYFIETIPEIFDNEDIKERAALKLSEIGKKHGFTKKVNREWAKETTKSLENIQKAKVKVKEE